MRCGTSSKRPRGGHPNLKRRPHRSEVFREEDVDDEIDAFHKQRSVIPLDVNARLSDSDDDAELPVFNLEGDDVDDDDSDHVGMDDDNAIEFDSDDDDFNDIQPTKFAAKIAKQAKYMKEKFGAGDDEMHDDEDQEEQRNAVWGRSKNLYYSADNVDYELQSSDEDLPMEEEAEVVKIQKEKAKSLQLEDFGLEGSEEDDGDSDQESLGHKKTAPRLAADDTLAESTLESPEEIKKDLSSLSKEEVMDVVYRSAPELVALLSEMREALDQLRKVNPMLHKVRANHGTSKCMKDYLEVKQMLLMTYCQAICFYLLLKSEWRTIRDHPVIARLVEIKNLMEKIKQIDVQIPSQLEDYVASIGELNSKLAGDGLPQETNSIAGKIFTVNLQEEVSRTIEGSLGTSRHMLLHNDAQLKEAGADKSMNDHMGTQSVEMLKIRANLEEKLKQKGLYNLKGTKPERTNSHTQKPINGRLITCADFDDEVLQTKRSNGLNKNVSNKISKLAENKKGKLKFVSGDDDLPKRDDIGERRRKHELRVLARVGAEPAEESQDGSDDLTVQGNGDLVDAEDDFYKEVKKRRVEKLAAKAEKYSRNSDAPLPLEVESVEGKRLITYQMEKNRGLTRNRKKLIKNPRKKYKLKHQKAVVRRRGQVRDIKKPSGPYGGESSGINPNVSHSIRFKS